MNQHIVAFLMLFSDTQHVKAPVAPVAQEAPRGAYERKVESYRNCLATAKAARESQHRGASVRQARAADCIDPGLYIARSAGPDVPAASSGYLSRPEARQN